MLLAFDDTDSLAGGCTTQVAFHVLAALPELALRGLPRLVRLNPNVPWKTRGNAAVALPLGLPEGPQVRVGEVRGLEVLAFPEGRPPPPEMAPFILEKAWAAVGRAARPEAQPSAALAAGPLPAAAYWQAAQARVGPAAARALLDASGALHASRGSGRALAGCAGALAWPGPPASCEFIAYRRPERCGSPRAVDPAPLAGLDASGATFHTFDEAEGRLVCVPQGPDPVLCGLRGRDPDLLREAAAVALSRAAQEEVDGWLLWATNQGSGDHVVAVDALEDAPEWATVQADAAVAGAAQSQAGGHVFLPVTDLRGRPFLAAAFERTRGLRGVLRSLRPGDAVTVVGALREGPDAGTPPQRPGLAVVNLEKLRVRSLAGSRVKAANPRCGVCGKAMKSRGARAGYKCPGCGARAGPEAGQWEDEPRAVALGWHEVPVLARRHLHRPLAWDAPGNAPAAHKVEGPRIGMASR